MHFPEQPLDWDHLLDEFANSSTFSFGGLLFQERINTFNVQLVRPRGGSGI